MFYKLNPILTYNLWGGEKLSNLYGQKENQYGEAWILSCLGNRNSSIGRGHFHKKEYMTLRDLFNDNPDIVRKGYRGEFPLLIKLIDAEKDLSIQVHPKAKTEFWHVLNDKPSHLYMGFNDKTNRNKVANILKTGDITKSLNHIEVKQGSSYLIKPGTIHAIGAGTFLIEIQRSADVTYRLYDFHRKDKDGKERELHIKDALEVINYSKYRVTKRNESGLLVKCPYFKVFRDDLNKEVVTNKATDASFHAVVVINGCGKIKQGSQTRYIKTGDCIFIPAGSGNYKVFGKLSIITVTL